MNKMKTTFTPEELDGVIAEISDQVSEYLRKDEAFLAKAVGDEQDEESEGASGPAVPLSDESEEEGSAPAEAPPMDEGSAPAEAPPMDGAPPMDEGSAPVDGAPDDGTIAPAPTVEELQAEYATLDPEQLKLHFLACKQAIMAAMGGDPAQAPQPAPMAPPGAAPMAPPGPEASAPPAMKGEMSSAKSGGEMSKGKPLGKSEKDLEIDLLREQLAKNEEALMALVDLVAKPLRKSVKGISELAFLSKDGGSTESTVPTLTKSEIISVLREKAKSDTTLKKSDRDLITKFTIGSVDASKIEHLLK